MGGKRRGLRKADEWNGRGNIYIINMKYSDDDVFSGPAVMKVFRLPLQRFGYYRGYRATTNPTATNAFATAAFRFGHSLVQHTLMRCDKTGKRIPFSKSHTARCS